MVPAKTVFLTEATVDLTGLVELAAAQILVACRQAKDDPAFSWCFDNIGFLAAFIIIQVEVMKSLPLSPSSRLFPGLEIGRQLWACSRDFPSPPPMLFLHLVAICTSLLFSPWYAIHFNSHGNRGHPTKLPPVFGRVHGVRD
jgi:hypothetical protein